MRWAGSCKKYDLTKIPFFVARTELSWELLCKLSKQERKDPCFMRLLAINSATEEGDILCSTLEDFNAAHNCSTIVPQ